MSIPADQPARLTIRTDPGTLFVEAGAGTGKTTELVTRVVLAVASGVLPAMQGLAAITFTENAAAELRTRIREALEAGAAGRHGDTTFDADQRKALATALEQIDDAAITTLHGFAARVLQDVPLEAGLPPGFTVSDAVRARVEANARWRAFLDDLLDDGTVAQHVLVALTLELRTDRLREVADAFAGSWDALEDRPFAEVQLPPVDVADVLVPLRHAAAFADHGPEGDALTEHLEHVVAPAVLELSSLTDPLDLLDALYRLEVKPGLSSAKAWAAVGCSKPEVVAHLKQVQEARAMMLGAVGAAAAETLCARVQDFTLDEAARRRREGSVTFHDLLVLTRDVLRSDASVRRRLHERFPTLLIDEFQDTDPLQVEIACLIAGTTDPPPAQWSEEDIPAGGLFFVGDPKQSIYRFRRADVQLYASVGKLFRSGHTELDVNFRSVPAVVTTVNHVFADLIGSAKTGQVDYADLRPFRADHCADRAVRIIGGPIDKAGADELREKESAHLADIAVRAKTEKWQVRGPDDADGNATYRDASYRDIAVLLPTRTSLPAIEAALQVRDVPYRIESRSLVWATDAVRDAVTLLQALVAPADEVAVVATLRHPGLACNDRDLVEWAAAGGRWNYLADRPGAIPDEHPVALGMATLRKYHDLRWWLPVNELVEQIVRDLRLVELTAELRRPRDHWRRLRFVVDQARAFCDSGGHGLAEFVQWASDQIESEADVLETVVPESDDDAVRILTVHGAKGLEFPITVLAGLGIGPRNEASVLWAQDGARPEVRLKGDWLRTSGFEARKEAEKALSLAEAVRLLYVAMTRAKDFLVISGYHKPVASKGSYGSHAQQLWVRLGEPATVLVEPAPTAVDEKSPQPEAITWQVCDETRDTVAKAHTGLLADVQSRVATTPTALVLGAAAAAGPAVEDEPDLDRSVESADPEPASVPPRRMPSRKGAAIGTAVHAVLELANLAAVDRAEFRTLAALTAADEEVPELAEDVAQRALAAAQSPLVTAAAKSGRYWREVYLVVRDGERVLEGYVDLLVEDDDGDLVVVDYKTDRASSPTEVAAKVEHYRPQLAAYGRALGQALDREIKRGALVFARPSGAEEVLLTLTGDAPPAAAQ